MSRRYFFDADGLREAPGGPFVFETTRIYNEGRTIKTGAAFFRYDPLPRESFRPVDLADKLAEDILNFERWVRTPLVGLADDPIIPIAQLARDYQLARERTR